METEGQWCDNASCPDCGKIGAGKVQIHSYAERRFRCTTCHRTFSADKGTFFETLRTPRPILLDVVAMLVERNSLRAISRIKHCKADAVLHWLQLAGQQGAAVNRHFIRDVHPTQVQVDELWSFVKKHKGICNRVTLPTGVTPWCGVRAPCRVISASCPTWRTSAARRRQRLFWQPSKHVRMGTRPCSPVIGCRLTSRPSLPTTAHQSRLQLNAGVVARAKHRDGWWMRPYSMRRWINGASKDVWSRSTDASSSVRAKSSPRCLVASRSTRLMSSVTTSPRARVSGAWCAKHCRIRRRALACGAISHLRMQSSISYARIKRCVSPFHNPRRGANGSNELRRWQQSSQTISGVSKNYFRIVSLLPKTKTSFTA